MPSTVLVIGGGPAGSTAAALDQLFPAAEQAGLMATGNTPKAPVGEAPGKFDAHDLFDSVTGSYLRTVPTLGIGRAR
ncbi:hypothetical protein ACFOY2_41260 [Nonomuraea purpurea]|uniref:Uncharacterized protein n=1 Tax=Nonomuraea purpurea TaxID=1849276 RepID=A0ABV8GLC0_9ACTN